MPHPLRITSIPAACETPWLSSQGHGPAAWRSQRAVLTWPATAAALAVRAVEAPAVPPAATPAISVSTPTAMAILVVQRIRIRICVPFA